MDNKRREVKSKIESNDMHIQQYKRLKKTVADLEVSTVKKLLSMVLLDKRFNL